MSQQPIYRVQLFATVFHAEFVCLGEQMLEIVRAIELLCPACKWSYCDVRTNGPGGSLCRVPPSGKPLTLHRPGSTENFVEEMIGVNQLESGVFWAGRSPDTLLRKYLGDYPNPETEDPAFSPMGAACVEVRAFDTTMFEVYFQDSQLADHFASSFQVPVESAPTKS